MSASRFFLLPIWLYVPVVAVACRLGGHMHAGPVLLVLIAAAAASIAVRYAGDARDTPFIVAAALLFGPVVIVHSGGPPIPIDIALYALAALGALIAYADWRPLAIGAGVAVATATDVTSGLANGAIIAAQALVLSLVVRKFTQRVVDEEQRVRRLHADLANAGAELQTVSVERDAVAAQSRQVAHRLDHLANHDPTTRLPNRALMMERLREALIAAPRIGTDTIVLYLDLADLKAVNDTTGHDAGDRALAIIALRIRRSLRAGDIASRVGGDEFVIVCSAAHGAGETTQIAERLMAAVSEPIRTADSLMHLGSNIGISIAPTDGNDADDLIHKAEAAMYRAKQGGINTFHVFTAAIHAEMLEKAKLRRELEAAIGNDEFVVHYQPIVSLTSGALMGAEALVRWMHPTRGLLPPSEFIGFAEANGLITAIGEVVMNKACAQINRFALGRDDEFTMAVNVSAVQFRQAGFVDAVSDLLAAHRIDSPRLEIEITESVIMDDTTSVIGQLQQLEARGVRLSIDDFGTGYSSLAYVKQFPVHTLKIDRSFVSDLAENSTDQAIAATIITLAHNLGMRVIAEGIETAEQLERLRTLGADDMQGHLVSRPLPAAEFERFVCSFGRLRIAA